MFCPGFICNHASAAVICHQLGRLWEWGIAARAAGMAPDNDIEAVTLLLACLTFASMLTLRSLPAPGYAK